MAYRDRVPADLALPTSRGILRASSNRDQSTSLSRLGTRASNDRTLLLRPKFSIDLHYLSHPVQRAGYS